MSARQQQYTKIHIITNETALQKIPNSKKLLRNSILIAGSMSPSCSPSTVLFVSNTEFDTENKKTPNNYDFSNTELDTEKTKHE